MTVVKPSASNVADVRSAPLSGGPTTTPVITTSGLASTGPYTGTFTDGLYLDYSSPTGRFSVGTSDGFGWYNGATLAATQLASLSSTGAFRASQIIPAAGANTAPSLTFAGMASSTGLFAYDTVTIAYTFNTLTWWGFGPAGLALANLGGSIGISWLSGSALSSAADLAIFRSAAGVLEINSGVAGTQRDLALRNIVGSGSFASAIPTTVSTATHTTAATDTCLIYTVACTETLPAAASFPGRELRVVTQGANAIISASSNVVPITGGAAGTAILPATGGTSRLLKSDGANWITVA